MSPFPTGGGNRVLNLNGSGLLYNDSVNTANYEVAVDYVNLDGPTFSDKLAFDLIVRVDASFNCYIAHFYIQLNQSMGVAIGRYTSSSDTLNFVNFSTETVQIYNSNSSVRKISFRALDKNLCALLDDKPIVGFIDSTIASGSPGIGSNLRIFGPNVGGQGTIGLGHQIDNFRVYSIS
jgi:hypothetical protein